MPLTEHLVELRKRILISLVFLFIAFIGVFNYSETLFDIKILLRSPYIQITKKTPVSLYFFAPVEAFWMHMKVSFVAALILSLPLIFYQLWRFISPGLLEKERKYVFPFVLSATTFFLIGALFCFLIVLPFAMTFFLEYKTANITPMLSVEKYIDFCLKFILAFGAIFELPLVIIFLTRFGIVSPGALARNRKYAVLVSFIAAAILTPTPDAFNMTLMAIPMIILYEIGILVSRIMYRKRDHA
jgi:sec-independent protein translocase protein TatC